ncbi:2-octaprenyl-3-methyl-6-methoxy-1,4-benzoquinol hydroxylase [Enterovibrio nigricans]|uniref:2-octaprenyl-3-methyl-6-methoxy-1,4-benzoquinol hydroxylase n=1 Tax=Enterovibrio nigricans DSM 22720 TaxID=1121868 RepID=A0A1T4U3S7_9GAMM|nr:2-octaprenyl-3-methyl-6-methoxy-1,4-benzoquinol hydroxylase [Enterovibrio nigricans]PKF51840.1 2-octaprenyl-3-methyl-6-methoxy-1,4-benzoquinol hydroxylase [Enterovibrio nigricans]SKA47323.1 2-octaprenyl-3-methyl-6-methoxy-1,4-benzoquinol hydroxylase [Enterovibrio nigricans DSM 22720]
MKQFDIIVVGGGMVGAAAALGLAKQGKRVAMVERNAPIPYSPEQPMDLRVSAISPASIGLLKSLKVWGDVSEMRLCPYRRLETWEHPECRIRFDADSMKLSELGFIVENRILQLALWKGCETQPNMEIICPGNIVAMRSDENGHVVELESGEMLHGRWLLGADGANSRVRDYAKIGVTAWDYRQHCMLINVKTELPQQDITWQWFTPEGPRSFLPLPGHQGSLVWYDTPVRIKQLCGLSPDALRDEVLKHFPKELGNIEVLGQGAFPLTRRHAQRYYRNNVVLLGDAAHTINPLAGQGVNLGFKDVDALLDVVADAGVEWLDETVLKAYEYKRKPDNLMMQTGMDVFYGGFSNDIAPLKLLRNVGLKLAENSGAIKQQVLKYAMGL